MEMKSQEIRQGGVYKIRRNGRSFIGMVIRINPAYRRETPRTGFVWGANTHWQVCDVATNKDYWVKSPRCFSETCFKTMTSPR